MTTLRTIGFMSAMGAALLVPFQYQAKAPKSTPATYTIRTIASGLAAPGELQLAGDDTLFLGQAPLAPRDASLAKLSLRSGEVTYLGADSAVLTGFAVNREGRLYWVDASRGALLSQGRPGEPPQVIHKGPALPAARVAADSAGRIYITRTSPVADGRDSVAILVRGSSLVQIPDPGGPPKTSVTAAVTGDLYYTSMRDGVIYHIGPDGRGNVVVAGLDKPQGIALGPDEDTLYFTEIPTPGIAGEDGGRNTVNALDLSTLERSVIHRGDPQPTGIAVASNGTVYWTSTSRGLVLAAIPSQAAVQAAPFVATLTGSEEVPPVDTQASGLATFTPYSRSGDADDDDDDEDEDASRRSELRYTVAITGLGRVRRLAIHQGDAGVVGPLVATLSRGKDSDDDRSSSQGFSIRGRLREKNLRGPFKDDWQGFIAALSAGSLYLNVYTRSQPTGEIRGQILPSGTPGNRPPDATITAPSADATVQAGQAVTFTGTASDPDGQAVTVLWDFGDGTTSAVLAPGAHVFPVVGTYPVSLTATDAQGLADPSPATRTITVQPVAVNRAPSATILAPAGNVTLTAGQSVSFSGTAADPDGDAVTVLWDFGDGGTSTLLNPGARVYASPGTYTVRLTATDAQGLADPAPPTRTITVQPAPVNQAPNGTITTPASAVTISAGQSVAFAGAATDPNDDPVTVLWNFGDGTTSTSLTPGNHAYGTAGTYTVSLTATDSFGLADPTPATRVITVNPVVVAATLTQIQTTLFTPSCVSCHDPGGSAGLNLTAGSAFSNLVNVPATTSSGSRVVPGNPASSVLVTFLADGHRNVSAANQALISSWISAGALNN